ncbi:MAG: phosphoglycerate kinase [bacterium]|nr:phosphoglycerate kinase [bacterium]
MNLPDLKNADMEAKRVLMRVDYNVGFISEKADGTFTEEYRIKSSKDSIDYILSKRGAKLALLSHFGEPASPEFQRGKPEEKQDDFSFKNLYRSFGKILGREIVFIDDCVGEKVKDGLDNLKEGQILMLENTRFHKEEVLNDKKFAGSIASNFDIYINEAFGVSHRNHSSVARIAEFLPSFTGFNFQKEVEELGKIRFNFKRPAVAIIGGAKIGTKMPVIQFFSENYDYVLLGGKVGMEAIKNNFFPNSNVFLPKDEKGEGLDIGPKTVEEFAEYIKSANTIVWNGPLGCFEKLPFNEGTLDVLKTIIGNKRAYKVAGGGETLQLLEQYGLISKFNFVSTGGGAMLDFLVQGTLPGIESLINSKK